MSEAWKSWADADPEMLEPFYAKWVGLLTSEGLHSKADIATVLALLDQRIHMPQPESAAPLPSNAQIGGKGSSEKVRQEPVAWLKEWGLNFDSRRVDLKMDCEPWLRALNPRITPLYASPVSARQAIPEGMVLVPREPTHAMLVAGEACLSFASDPLDSVRDHWRAMLAALDGGAKLEGKDG